MIIKSLLSLSFFLAVSSTFATSNIPQFLTTKELHVCCNCGNDASSTPHLRATPLNSIQRAQELIRTTYLQRTSKTSPSSVTVYLSNRCSPPSVFGSKDGGINEHSRVIYRSYPNDAPAIISGGVNLYQSSLKPVTDPSIIAQINPAALPYIQQIALSDLGIIDYGIPQCHPYMGGEASILPGNLVSAALEVFLYGDPTINGDLSPLTLARWPNKDHKPKQWGSGNIDNYTITVDDATAQRLSFWNTQLQYDPNSAIVHYMGGLGWDDHHNFISSINITSNSSIHACSGGVNCSSVESGYDYYGNDIQPPIPATSQTDCCAKCNALAGCKYYSYCTNDQCGSTNCYLKTSNGGRKAFEDRLSGPVTPVQAGPTITLSPCPSHYAEPGFDALDNAGTYYAYNLLYEIDSEGEYYVNRTSGMVYLWVPANSTSPYWTMAPWGMPVVGPLSDPKRIENLRSRQLANLEDTLIGEISSDNILLDFQSTSYITIDGVILTTARNVGVRADYTTSIIVSNSLLQNIGSMAINATEGSGFLLTNSIVRHAGNGAIFFYAGNRTTLTKANHVVDNSTVSYSNRYMYCYVPMVALADCGNTIQDSELFGGPHQGTFISGNEHSIVRSLLHDLVEACSDSGTVYMGRDWTYQGNLIANNTFIRINTANPGDDVSAVYLDDLISGFTIIGNTFLNVSRALLLGGGRDNIFMNNIVNGIDGTDAGVHFDNRGMGWSSASCTPPNGELVQFLNRVPYNTSAIWINSYPHLPNILQEEPCVPKYNAIINNQYCNLNNDNFIDEDNATIAGWGSTAWGNTAGC